MDEFKFVIKCFGFAAIFMVLTQIKTGDTTIEQQIEASLVNSTVSDFVNKTAEGGVKLLKDGVSSAKESYYNWKHSDDSKIEKTEDAIVEEVTQLPVTPPEISKIKLEEAQAKIEQLSAEDAELVEE